jgi:hypothetical protein
MPAAGAVTTDLAPLLRLPGAEWLAAGQAVGIPVASIKTASEWRMGAGDLSDASRLVLTVSPSVADRLVGDDRRGDTLVALPKPVTPDRVSALGRRGTFSLGGAEWVLYGRDNSRASLSGAAATRTPHAEDLGGRADWFSRRHRP